MASARTSKSLFQRLTSLFKSGNVAKQKIRTLDTIVAAPDKTKSSGAILFQKSASPTYANITANAYNLSERLMRYQDFCEMEYCIIGDTLIAQLDGFKTIKELADECDKDPTHTFNVYSYDHENRRLVVAVGKQARQTRVDRAWKVTFDSGKSIVGSANHRLMLRDGSYRTIEDLKIGDAMMPFYRKSFFKESTSTEIPWNDDGYLWVYTTNPDVGYNGWMREHKLVAECMHGRTLREDEVVHHINFKKHDNRPENLAVMTTSEHARLHVSDVNGKKWSEENVEWRDKFARGHARAMALNPPTLRRDVTFSRILETCESIGFNLSEVSQALDVDYGVIKSRLLTAGFSNFETFARAYCTGERTSIDVDKRSTSTVFDLTLDRIVEEVEADDTKSTLAIKLGCTVNVLDKFLWRKCGISWLQLRDKLGFPASTHAKSGRPKGSNRNSLTFQDICVAYEDSMTCPLLAKKLGTTVNTIVSRLHQNGYTGFRQFAETYNNHKVVSIEYVGVVPLYDLTVDGYKNFATDTVISHNTPEIASALDIYADEACLSGDSIIPLLDGTRRTIADMYTAGEKDFWVYSFDLEKSRLVPGKAAAVMKTGTKQLYRIEFDDGTYVRLTDNHRVLLSSGEYVYVRDLSENDSVRSLYTSLSNKTHGDVDVMKCLSEWRSQQTCDVDLKRLMKKACVDANLDIDVVYRALKISGYRNWGDYLERTNHRVKSITPDGIEDVYDITVEGWHNFAMTGTSDADSFVFVHNCSVDEKGQVLHVYSDNPKIKDVLERLFYDNLNVGFNLRSWTRNTVKYGDLCLYNDVSPEYGVINAVPIPINEIEREENYDPNDPMAHRFRWVTNGNRVLENWEVSHFRLLGNDMFLPYGSSVIESARRIWRQLILVEDAMLVYRIVRAPERRVYYIDIGNIPPADVDLYMEEQKKRLRSSQVVDRTSSRVDLRYNPLSIDEDIFVPVRGQDTGTKIETLAGGQNTAAVEDVAYIQKKLFAALKVPRAYLGYDESLCLAGDTRIPLLDGREVTIEELAKECSEGFRKQPWVYSTDLSGNVKPGKVVRAWATKQVDEMWKVTLDNGEVVECTGNHPFLCKDGEYRRADELTVGQSLMPVYRRTSSKTSGDSLEGYEMVWQDGEWVYTHKVINEAACGGNHTIGRARVIHHVDFDKRNNDPTNLAEMTWASHRSLHRKLLESTLLRPDVVAAREPGRIAALKSDGHRRKKSDQLRMQHADPCSAMSKWVHSDALKRGMSSRMRERWNDPTYREFKTRQNKETTNRPEVRVKMSGVNHWVNKKHVDHTFEWLVKYCNDNQITEKRHFHDSTTSGVPIDVRYLMKLLKENGYRRWRDFARDHINRNHKVVSVELIKLSEPRWVFDLEVEGWHNFLIKQGVQVHNSSKSTLAQEDIRFSRTINTIQRTMIAELNKLAIIHLYTHGFDDDDLQNFVLRMCNPSTVAQQQKLELWRSKFEIAGSAPEGYASRDFIRKELWGLNDEQCKSIDEQRLKEKVVDSTIEGATSESSSESGGVDDLFGGGGKEETAGGEEETGGGEEDLTAGDDVEEKDGKDLLTAGDDVDDDSFPIKFDLDDVSVPVKAQRQLDKVLYDRSRIKHSGPAKTHMPDFARTLGMKSKRDNDVYDMEFLSSYARNPLGEASSQHRTSIGIDTVHMLRRMSESPRFSSANKRPEGVMGVLSESVEEDVPDRKEFDEVYVIDDDV